MGPSPLLALLALLAPGSAKQCYDCGYQINGWKPDGPNEQHPLPEVALCGDTANWQNNVVDCGAEEECCGVVKEFFVTEANEGLPEFVDMQARHACETTLATAFDKYPEFICTDNLNKCFNLSMADIPEHEATFATGCFCEGDKCNNDIPVMPDPPTTQSTVPQPSRTCYNCGYKCTNMKDGNCTPQPIDEEGHVPFCGDSASMSSQTKKCSGYDECCGAIREYFEVEIEGQVTVDMITFHGCEKDLAGALGATVEVLCKAHEHACYNVSRVDIQTDVGEFATACFCEGDRCNDKIPDLPFPPVPPTDQPPTDQPGSRKCYSCGFRKDGINGDSTAMPDLDFCGDFADPTQNTVTCGAGDCCASIKEYFIQVDTATGENHTIIEGRHGCATDVDHLGHYSVTCNDHGESCFQVDEAHLDHDRNTTIVKAEICFCDRDLCNNADPVPEVPTTPTAQPPKTCYNCGYKCTDMKDGNCTPQPIDEEGKVPFCGDSASMSSKTKKCSGYDECCGAIREYFEVEIEGQVRVDMLTFHGCEKDLAGALNANIEVICKAHENACYNVSREDIQDNFGEFATACFCEGDRCNNQLPDLPFPPVPGNGAALATASILTLIIASLFLN